MTTRKHIATALAATLALGSLGAFAQGGPPDPDHDRGRPAYSNGHGPNGNGHPPEQRDHRDADRHHDRNEERYASRGPDRNDPRGGNWDARYGDRWGGARQWHKGERLPPEYRNRQYVVDDWRAHRLNPPPRGYQWVQVGGDYVLAAIATGIIANLIINQ